MSEAQGRWLPRGRLKLVTQGPGEILHALPDLGEGPDGGTGPVSSLRSSPPGDQAIAMIDRSRDRDYDRGYREGREAARQELEQEDEENRARERETMEVLMRSLHDQMGGFLNRLEQEAFRFALAAAGAIVRREVTLDSAIVIRQVRDALRRVLGVESVILRVHPEDEPAVREHREELLSGTDSLREFIVEADEKIERGGCIIESPSGTIDARIATQLRQIETALLHVPAEAGKGQG